MAEAAPSSQSSPPAAPQQAAPELPEPDLDSLLSHIPDFKDIFGTSGEQQSGEKPPEEKKEPVSPESAEADVPVDGIAGLAAAQPIEEPAAEEPTEEPKEEPAPEPEKPDAVQKRIDKLTARAKTAEEKAAGLEAELTDLKAKFQAPPPVAPSPKNPLANVETQEELGRRFELSRTAKTWAIQHLDGGEIDLGEGKTQFLNGDQVKTLLARAEDMLAVHIPKQHQFLIAKQDFDTQAKKAYPSLFKAGHTDNAEYNSWLTVFPECRQYPDIALIVGDAIMGRAIRLQKANAAKAKNNGNSNPNPPLAAPAPAAQPRVPKSRVLSGPELSAIATNPDGDTLDRFVDQLISQSAAARPQRSQR